VSVPTDIVMKLMMPFFKRSLSKNYTANKKEHTSCATN